MQAIGGPTPMLKCLSAEPVLEAVCELRFESSTPGAATLLPGLLRAAFANDYPSFEALPSSNLPAAFRLADPNLRYAPTVRLMGSSGSLNLGDNVVSVSVVGQEYGDGSKYPGWKAFKERIETVFRMVLGSDLIGATPERVSIKYVNLLGSGALSDLTNIQIALGDLEVSTQPLQLRTELVGTSHVTVVQVTNPATVSIPTKDSKQAFVLEIDAVRTAAIEDISLDLSDILEAAHREAREAFFSLLTQQTVQQHGPIYD